MASTNKYRLEHYTKDGYTLGNKFLHSLRTFKNAPLYLIPQFHQYRPDLIARVLYGDPDMRWIFFVMNAITGIEAFAYGKKIKFISKADFNALYAKWKHCHGKSS